MKKFVIGLTVAISAIAVILPPVAEAKRLGSGGSFGKQSQSINRQPSAPAQNQATQQQAASAPAAAGSTAAAAAKPSPWKGILGGALLGLGLGALLSHLGMGGALASMIGTILTVALIALAGFVIYRLVKGKQAQQPQPAWAGATARSNDGFSTPEIGSDIGQRGGMGAAGGATGHVASAAVDAVPFGVPADFDVPGFVRHAKTYYIRLQAAWDKADLNDLRDFTTPEMFAEIKMQLQERGASANNTDVVSIDAELLGIETVGNDYIASVKFQGMIREADFAPTEPFAEVWNLAKPVTGNGGWALAGIQQLN